MINAIKSNNKEICEVSINEGADVNTVVEGKTPLILACEEGNIEICKYMIEEKGANVDIVVGDLTPLIAACAEGNIEICKYLIEEHEVNVNTAI